MTTTPVLARSARKASLKPSMKCLLAEYAADAGITVSPAPEPTLSTPPRPRSTIDGTRSAVSWTNADHVGVQYLAGAGPVRGVEQRLVAEAGVVDQDVHGPGPAHAARPRTDPRRARRTGRRESHHLQPRVRGHQLSPQCLEQAGPAGRNDQVLPGRKLTGQLTTDAEEAPVISTVLPSTGELAVTIAVLPGLLNANENLARDDLGSHIARVGSFAGTYVDVRPRAAGAVIARDRRERFGDQLADRGRFCRGPHPPPPHAYFDRDADPRLRSSHIGQVCCQLELVASRRKLDTAQICRHAARVVSRSSPQTSPSRRDQRRQETITDIKAAARTQLAEGGPTGISLRAIARDLGMTPSAVHYYFPGREALLDALIVDGWDTLAMALRARYEQTRPLRHTSGGLP